MAHYTVHKDKWDNILKSELEKAGVNVSDIVRGEERNLGDLVGYIYPGRSIITDYVSFGTNDDDKVKQIFGNKIPYYDSTNEKVGNGGCLGCGLLFPIIIGFTIFGPYILS